MSKRTIGLLLIAVVTLGAMTGVAAADEHLEVAVDTDGAEPTVNVTQNGTAVENATVTVSVVDAENESYDGTTEYTTDANGTVDLDVPQEDVTVNVTAEYDNETATAERILLEAPDTLAIDVSNTDGSPVVSVTDNGTAVENASVNVTTADGQNVTYVGEGTFSTDENGTVTLDAAVENVTVDVSATYENETVSTSVDLTADGATEEDQPFGQLLRNFIEDLKERDGGIGAAVSDFVTENNPGNAPDHAGGPGGPGENGAANGTDMAGNGSAPDNPGQGSGNGTDGGQGPPEHAGNGNSENGNGGGNGGNGAANGNDRRI